MNTIYVFYTNEKRSGKYIRGYKNIREAKNFAEKLYKDGFYDISLRPINEETTIYKMMYKVIYELGNKKRMTSLVGYSDDSASSYCHINRIMNELGVQHYKVIPVHYDCFVKTFNVIKEHKEEKMLHNIERERCTDVSLSNLFLPKVQA